MAHLPPSQFSHSIFTLTVVEVQQHPSMARALKVCAMSPSSANRNLRENDSTHRKNRLDRQGAAPLSYLQCLFVSSIRAHEHVPGPSLAPEPASPISGTGL